MWLMLELPDECQDAVAELLKWQESRRHGSDGMIVAISPGNDLQDRKLLARVLEIQTT
jgi:hypothetical protein